MALIEYSKVETFDKVIDIVDIGNTSLEIETTEGFYYYLLTKTVMGKTLILTFGPIFEEASLFLKDFNLNCKIVDYKEQIIIKIINKYVNTPLIAKNITNVQELTDYELLQKIPDVEQIIANFGKE